MTPRTCRDLSWRSTVSAVSFSPTLPPPAERPRKSKYINVTYTFQRLIPPGIVQMKVSRINWTLTSASGTSFSIRFPSCITEAPVRFTVSVTYVFFDANFSSDECWSMVSHARSTCRDDNTNNFIAININKINTLVKSLDFSPTFLQ